MNKYIYVYGIIFQTDLHILIEHSQCNFPKKISPEEIVTKMPVIAPSS